MTFELQTTGRRSIRLKEHNYASPGGYFVTLCAESRKCLFGKVVDGTVEPSPFGQVVSECWEWLAQRFGHVALDAWVVMPNHLHGIILLRDGIHEGGSRTAPTIQPTTAKPLGRLIGAFKTASTKRINLMRGTPGAKLWQRNYDEHIVRNEKDLRMVRQYIAENPIHWEEDEENPDKVV